MMALARDNNVKGFEDKTRKLHAEYNLNMTGAATTRGVVEDAGSGSVPSEFFRAPEYFIFLNEKIDILGGGLKSE